MKDTSPEPAIPASTPPPARKLTLKAAMALVAATAVGFGLIRYSQLRYFAWDEPAASGRLVYHTLLHISKLGYGCLPVLYALSAVVVGAGLRGARPRREQFSVRPGLAACAAAQVALAAAIVFLILNYAIGRNPGVYWSTHSYDVLTNTAPGLWSPKGIEELFAAAGDGAMPAILAVWMLQWLCSAWKPAPEWPDRLGRAVGWIFMLWMLTPH
jgi:hypothetical protein